MTREISWWDWNKKYVLVGCAVLGILTLLCLCTAGGILYYKAQGEEMLSAVTPIPPATASPPDVQVVLPTAVPAEITHIVQAGESLSTIAEEYGVEWLAIAQANGIQPPYVIHVGQNLTIPATTTASEMATPVIMTFATPTPPPAPLASPKDQAGGQGDIAEAAEVHHYIPGGPNYAWPEEGSVEWFADGWHRVRQAANGQHLPWTFFVRVTGTGATSLEQFAQWDSATKLLLRGPINAVVEIRRDLQSSQAINPDPYTVANVKNSALGLGWFVAGNGATVTVGGQSVQLTGLGVHQMAFPHDWTGTWYIQIAIQENGQVILNQGERLTDQDTWPLPQ